jgi:hypothetical protein
MQSYLNIFLDIIYTALQNMAIDFYNNIIIPGVALIIVLIASSLIVTVLVMPIIISIRMFVQYYGLVSIVPIVLECLILWFIVYLINELEKRGIIDIEHYINYINTF